MFGSHSGEQAGCMDRKSSPRDSKKEYSNRHAFLHGSQGHAPSSPTHFMYVVENDRYTVYNNNYKLWYKRKQRE